ncbi:VOC family protein [Nonomuraea sp. NPDC049152]|uniref:VOC family protein n=1 Tax=Nonomuraea sp. NPDC049152 TaxID=3154350 RepID=UPI0033EBDC51
MTLRLSRREISDAVGGSGWRFVLGAVRTSVPVTSLARAAEVAARVAATAGGEGDGSLWMDVRGDRVVLTLQSLATGWVTPLEIDLAHRLSAAVSELGLRADPEIGDQGPRSVQMVEIAIDALDIAAIRPFWKAVMGYAHEAGASGPEDALVDPVGQGAAIWFQQMDAPRPQRNRVHFDVSVPHDEAPLRIAAALAAGGMLLSDAAAPAFWVLADAEGNEACVTTWQGRD